MTVQITETNREDLTQLFCRFKSRYAIIQNLKRQAKTAERNLVKYIRNDRADMEAKWRAKFDELIAQITIQRNYADMEATVLETAGYNLGVMKAFIIYG